jgi:hypothetical protein
MFPRRGGDSRRLPAAPGTARLRCPPLSHRGKRGSHAGRRAECRLGRQALVLQGWPASVDAGSARKCSCAWNPALRSSWVATPASTRSTSGTAVKRRRQNAPKLLTSSMTPSPGRPSSATRRFAGDHADGVACWWPRLDHRRGVGDGVGDNRGARLRPRAQAPIWSVPADSCGLRPLTPTRASPAGCIGLTATSEMAGPRLRSRRPDQAEVRLSLDGRAATSPVRAPALRCARAVSPCANRLSA